MRLPNLLPMVWSIASIFRKLGILKVMVTLLGSCYALTSFFLWFHISTVSPMSLQYLSLFHYSMTNICLQSYLLEYQLVHFILLWEFYAFDYDQYKWRERRRQDLSLRPRHRVLGSLSSPEGDTLDWDCFPTPTHTPMEQALYHSLCFDDICRHTPDFMDILTTNFVQPEQDQFCGLLDDAGVGIYMFDEDSDIIVFDTGASVSISNDSKDFVTWDSSPTVPTLQGITSTATVQGSGVVRWVVRDDNGKEHTIETKAYFVPNAKVRLLSPQRFLRTRDRGAMILTPGSTTFFFDKHSPLTFHSLNNNTVGLPLASLHRRRNNTWLDVAQLGADVLEPANINLTLAQKELLSWHYRLGHYHLAWIQQLARPRPNAPDVDPLIPLRHKASMSNPTTDIKCHACRLGKAVRRPDGTHIDRIRTERDGGLSKEVLRFGAKIATDQFVSSVKGRRFETKGKEKDDMKFSGGTIFVDISSGYIEVFPQVSLRASETIYNKRKFERTLNNFGHTVNSYLGDNGVYKSNEFQDELKQRGQTMEFCGVGAHHQNGVAERAIRTVSESARTMMLHASIHWPGTVTLDLWPMAVEYAAYLYNIMPNINTQTAPIELLTGSRMNGSDIRNARVWGCPAYVLDPKIQDGNKLPRWVPKARRGQFVGRSRVHASTVGLIRNFKTGNITTQFHVTYDDFFTTAASTNTNISLEETWPHLFQFMSEDLRGEDEQRDDLPELSSDWLTELEQEGRRNRHPDRPARLGIRMSNDDAEREEVPRIGEVEANDDGEQGNAPDLGGGANNESSDEEETRETEGVRRNPVRILRGINRRYHNDEFVTLSMDEKGAYILETVNLCHIATLDFDSVDEANTQLLMIRHKMNREIDENNELHYWDPLFLATKASADDNPNLQQVMSSPEWKGWEEAMMKELNSLEEMKVYEVVPRSTVKGQSILDTTWAFKRKRYPDGSIRKLKARLCARGDQQVENVDFFETYAPVVQWGTVRVLLVLSVTLGLISKQVDYTNAFVHADMDTLVYVEMPPLFGKEGYVWKLNKSLYGLRQSPLNFFNHLKEGLESRNWEASEHDPCLFYKNGLTCLVYVDDCLFFGTTGDDIVAEIELLREPKPTSFSLAEESDVAGFLGILMNKTEEGIELKQTGLIDRILTLLGLENSAPKSTPAERTPLGKDDDGQQRQEGWNYRSAIGMMMYLATNSRPDIAFAVNQCCRFANDPKRSHEKAVKRIGRYLQGTKDRGMVIKPDERLGLDLYADADFAGLFQVEDPEDPVSVKSRTGWVVTFGGIPVTWSSKLQSEIALSTMEAEYIALSTGMRELVGTRKLIGEITEKCKIKREETSRVSKVFEDNEAALKHAVTALPKLSPRTKHIGVKYHWFKKKIKLGEIELYPIGTKSQKADIFTKGLGSNDFGDKRKLIMGW